MIPHPETAIVVRELQRQELLAEVARERRAELASRAGASPASRSLRQRLGATMIATGVRLYAAAPVPVEIRPTVDPVV